jgi:hypothetical protein
MPKFVGSNLQIIKKAPTQGGILQFGTELPATHDWGWNGQITSPQAFRMI